MAKDIFANHRTNTIVIGVLILLFIAVIYIPKTIWDKEIELRDEARFRMNAITQAEKLFYQLSRMYTADTQTLEYVINAVRDSVLKAENDTNYSYYGEQIVTLPGRTIKVNYSQDYMDAYVNLHKDLFKKLQPNHYLEREQVTTLLDTIKTLFDMGGYVGEHSLMLDSVQLSFTVPEHYNIYYQNIYTRMFNALTGSYTPYPDFSNPLVDAILDSLDKNPQLNGRVDFDSIYTAPVRIDFAIPVGFTKQLDKTLLTLKKHLILDPVDSAMYGDTLYNMALQQFVSINDTSESIPLSFEMLYMDTSGSEIVIPVNIDSEPMKEALGKRRNATYLALTGYNEPSAGIAEKIIAIAMDSIAANPDIIDSIHVDLDISDVVFNINIHRNVEDFYFKTICDEAYYKLNVNLADLDWNEAAVDVVEFIADTLRKKSDYKGWQVLSVEADTLNINVPDNFMRSYDNMNLKLYEILTGEFNNVHDYAGNVIMRVKQLSGIDSLDFSGEQLIEFTAETLQVFVPEDYVTLYDSTFIIERDTVVQVDDSTFSGVWARGILQVIEDIDHDSLSFLSPRGSGQYRYDFSGVDSVQGINILERSDTSMVEKVYSGVYQYIVVFNEDSVIENVYQLYDQFIDADSIPLLNLNVVSDEFVVGTQEKQFYMEKDSFGGWLDTLISNKYQKKQLYSIYPFTKELTVCPVTGLPFRITIRNNVNLTVESPIEAPIKSSRYLFFSQIDSTHGRIVDGEVSWKK